MGTEEDYAAKLKEITAIAKDDIINPGHIPVSVYIQEALDLSRWCPKDKADLVASGLKWEIVDDIPKRVGALRQAEANWHLQKFTKKSIVDIWLDRSAIAFELRSFLIYKFRFAYRKNTRLLNSVNDIAGNTKNATMLQDLYNLAVIGKNNQENLKEITFDFSKLEEAVQMADELAPILASANAESDTSELKVIRDKAFTCTANKVVFHIVSQKQ